MTQDDSSLHTAISEEVTKELVQLLTGQMFEEFITLFRDTAHKFGESGAAQLAEAVNLVIHKQLPDSGVKVCISQRTQGKHIVTIIDGSRFFGENWTMSRQMFVV